MSGRFKLTTRIQNYLRGSRVPPRIPSHFSHQNKSALEAPRPTSIPGLRAERADLFPKPKITEVTVEQRIAELKQVANAAPKLEEERIQAQTKKRRVLGPIAAGSLAALAITLIPKLAFAGTLGGTLAALASTPLGIAALVGGGALLATFYIKYMFGFDKTMGERNANPGDKTLLKHIATFSMIPLTIMAGSGLLYLGACFLPWGATPTFFTAAGVGLLIGLYKTAKSIYQSIKANRQTITPGAKPNIRGILGTNILSYAVQGAEAAYMFYRGATVFELLIGVGAYVGHAVATAGLASLGAGALYLGAPLFLLASLHQRFTSKKWNEFQHEQGPRYDLSSKRGIRTVLLTATGAAAAGVLLWGFAQPLLNLTLAFAFLFTEVHALIHNWSCQGGSREIIKSPPKEFSDTKIWKAARRLLSPWITVQKPSLNPKEFIVPILATLYLRKGPNWDFLNIVSGGGVYKDSRETIECMRFMQEKQEAVLSIIERSRTRINGIPGLGDKYAELANLYEKLDVHWQRESVGDFRTLTVSDIAGETNVFSRPDAENFEAYLGQAIAYEGRKFSLLAAELRRRQTRSQEEIDEHLGSLTQQFSAIFHWFSTSQFRNLAPDVRRSKIRKIDLVNMLLKTYKTGASILRKNRFTEKYYWEFIPCKRIRALDTETNTLDWTNRSDAEMADVQSFSDIAHADNTGMADPTGPVYSPEAGTYGRMHQADRFTLNYKNGRRETFILRGGKIVADDHGRPRDPNTEDEVVWVPGMPLSSRLAANLPKEWRDQDGKIHEEYIRPRLFHIFGSRYQTMLDGEHADIQTSNFLASLLRDLLDPYIFSLWKVPEKVTVPNALHLRESPQDRLVRIHASYACFMLRVKERESGMTLHIPYDWKKSRKISDDFWTEIDHVELMSREDFQKRFGVVCTDNHGDKHENVIVAYDANGNKLGKPNEALPYSYYLREPSFYTPSVSVKFNRGLGRIGDMIFVAYTFERADEKRTRYIRWLPKEEDFQEMDFDERYQRHEVQGNKIILHACRWIGKKIYYDRHRLVLDPGLHENPNFELTAITGPEEFLRSIGARSRFVIARSIRNADGTLTQINYNPFAGKIKNLDNVVDQRINGRNLELIRITQDDKRVVALGNDQILNHESHWISSVAINEHPTDRTKVRVTISFTNPFNGTAAGTQELDLDKKIFPNIDAIYRNGNNQAYIPKIFDQKQKNKETKQIENKLFLTFYTCNTESVQHALTLAANEEIKLIEVKSSLRIQHLTSVNGKNVGKEELIPFDHEMPKASKSTIWFDPDNKPFTSELSFGRIDTVVGPQHLVPIRSVKGGPLDDLILAPLFGHGLAGAEWATDDQKYYFAEREGEYNFYAGWIRPQVMPRFGSRGPVGIQYAKYLRRAALNTGSNTVKRAPDRQHLLFPREELELYAENGMPVPLLKSLFDAPTTTEDAQSAWEAQRMFDEETENQPDVNTIGSSVKNVEEAVGQRDRWAAMVAYLQRIKKIFVDEIVRARILKRIPPQYTNKQLHEWFNTFTWYLDTVFKHVVPLIPFVYMLGLSPLPAGAIVFPLLWFIKTATGWPKYSSDNQKVGVSRIRSYFRNLALYYLFIPGIERSVKHINDEAGGPFMTIKPKGKKTFQPWAVRRIVFYFGGLSGITTAVGIYRMLAFGLSYFGFVMNVVWPAFMFAGVAYALKMVWNDMKHKKNLDTFGLLRATWQALWRREIEPYKRWWSSLKSRMGLLWQEFLKPCTADWFIEVSQSFKNAYRYYVRGEY